MLPRDVALPSLRESYEAWVAGAAGRAGPDLRAGGARGRPPQTPGTRNDPAATSFSAAPGRLERVRRAQRAAGAPSSLTWISVPAPDSQRDRQRVSPRRHARHGPSREQTQRVSLWTMEGAPPRRLEIAPKHERMGCPAGTRAAAGVPTGAAEGQGCDDDPGTAAGRDTPRVRADPGPLRYRLASSSLAASRSICTPSVA